MTLRSSLKQVIVVDQSLGLPPGKLAAQVAHAAIIAFLRAAPPLQRAWLESGMTKIVLACDSAAALRGLADQAQAAGLSVGLVADAGRTVVAAGTLTCVGIGPDEAERVNAVTSALRLLG
ncbi:MAG: aminoacyl-tRNA hydrolase [Caulobacteraceae bacterium]|nr:aminoacyl-tRNA hydrolase [Caulobacteraceae bacterium]